jgi:3-oxoacyl-[acyl-carrier-protein] synthase-3
MEAIRSVICGCGSYLPSTVVTNEALTKTLDTSDEWIVSRTGIRQRHIAAAGELTSDLGTRAAERALAAARLSAGDVDLIVVATTTPDDTFPATATRVQAKLGMTRGIAFDVQAVCSGFIFALAVADNFIKTGQVQTALVIGAETYSRILDWNDRDTCVLFGDGAGAVVLQGESIRPNNPDERGILSTHLHSDGRYRDILYVDGGPSSTQTVGHLRMTGREVFRHAVTNLVAVAEEALAAHGLPVAAIDLLVPHQANVRIVDSVARRLGLPHDRVISTVDRHANTSAASIPLALDVAISDGRIQHGHLVLMEAIGGGLSWGACLARW